MQSQRSRSLLALSLFLAFFHYSPAETKIYEVGELNVENLFNGEHEIYKEKEFINGVTKESSREVADYTYLPINDPRKKQNCNKMSIPYFVKQCETIDWTPDKFRLKLKQIKKTLLAGRTNFPHFLGIIEISTEKTLQALKEELGYRQAIISTRPDFRGVRLALLYDHSSYGEDQTFTLKQKISHTIKDPLFREHPTRDILEVQFKVQTDKGESLLTFFINHWPSQQNPAIHREVVAIKLNEIVKQRLNEIEKQRMEVNYNVILMGDFNTTNSDEHDYLNEMFVKSPLSFIHLMDYSAPAKDIHGTHFFQKKWNFLDRVYFSPNLSQDSHERNPLKIIKGSFRVHNYKEVTKERFYLVDSNKNLIQRVNADGTKKTKKHRVHNYKEVTKERFYLVDSNKNLIQRVNADGTKKTKKHNETKYLRLFSDPSDYDGSKSWNQLFKVSLKCEQDGSQHTFGVESPFTAKICARSTMSNVQMIEVPHRYNFHAKNENDNPGNTDHLGLSFKMSVQTPDQKSK